MELYFIRHGPAATEQEAGVDSDAQRPLTAEGEELSARVGAGLRRMGVRFDVVAASPLKRARQTADAIAEAMGAKERVLVTDTLRPGCRLTELADFVRTHPNAEHVAIVGHQPDMSTLTSDLIGGGRIHFTKAGLAQVSADEIAPGAGVLRLAAPPGVLALLTDEPAES